MNGNYRVQNAFSAGEHGDEVRADSMDEDTMKYAVLSRDFAGRVTTVAQRSRLRPTGRPGLCAAGLGNSGRINNGLRSGQLTWREYRYLEREQARIWPG